MATSDMKVKKFVVVPCPFRNDGKFARMDRPPHGYHHILALYEAPYDYWLQATIWGGMTLEQAMDVANLLAGGIPVEIDPSFYRR